MSFTREALLRLAKSNPETLVELIVMLQEQVQALTTQYAWRAWGLYQPFPLFFNVFFWWYDGDPASVKWFFIVAGLLGTFVAIPLLSWRHGKRFCTWICGCGGLAETLGDQWRHLSAKGERSRAWEFQTYIVLIASAMVIAFQAGVRIEFVASRP